MHSHRRFLLTAVVAISLLMIVAPVRRAAADDGAVFIGAGDIASCSSNADDKTAAIIAATGGDVFTAGDNVYQTGTAKNYNECYNLDFRHYGRQRIGLKFNKGKHVIRRSWPLQWFHRPG